uniref:Cytochrome c oxidase subunit 1 n=3 Tax=Kudoa septempunctata TaxID=751907 RepID=A0A0H5B3E1_9CNID|nr:cytochrome c oxidase subunit I [Kudoa septempunctata]BAR94682.1 cytochrome c oxidase subunit I [Kudoa septempunctata]
MIPYTSQNLLSAKIVAIGYWRIAFLASILASACSCFLRVEISFLHGQSSESVYFSLLTAHGLLFVFLVLVPIGQGYLNWWFPGQTGTWDFIWPRVNMGALLGVEWSTAILLLFWLPGGWNPGWTMYPPLASFQQGFSIDCIIAGIHALGVASGAGSSNAVVSFRLLILPFSRKELSIFVWSQFVAAVLFIGTIPSLALGLLGILLDRTTSSSWFDPSGGGDPVLYQLLFWFFGHPEVYVVVLPSFGVLSASLEANSGLYGKEGLISSVSCLGVLGYLVYAHHMFTVDLELEVKLLFSSGTMAIAVPTGVKVYSWMVSVRSGSLDTLQTFLPLLCFLATFIGGGLTGIMLSSSTADVLLHDTYFVVAHFHQVMAIAAFLAFACGVHWLGMMSHGGAIILFTIATMTIFLPLYGAGLCGIPRRVPSMLYEASGFLVPGYLGCVLAIMAIILYLIFL